MDQRELLAEQFEEKRGHLQGVAYRMLGSLSEAEDAVQEAWIRLNRSEAADIDNLGGWLTTVVARVCLDLLRSRKSKAEDPLDEQAPHTLADHKPATDPEHEAVLADSVGLALLVVLDTLTPAERLAFVLHDMFDLSFDEIATVVGRSPIAARQLASRARRRVRGEDISRHADLQRQRQVVDAFLAAARGGDFAALLEVLDPDVVLRSDPSLTLGLPPLLQGATAVAERSIKGGARAARPVLVDGSVGVVVAPRGRLLMVLRFTLRNGKIAEIESIADPERVRQLDLAVLN
ncbi:MAG TPA: sigma-70 family RNA polymerase sigma factor [Acidobacteriaceae bacterium]